MSSPFSPAGGLPVQTCQQCNAPLPALGGICGNCGYQNNALPIHATQQHSQNPPLGNASPPALKKGLMQQFGAQQEGQASSSAMWGSAASMPPTSPSAGAGASPNAGMFRSQGGSGQYPPMQGAHPSQPLPAPSPSQPNAGMFRSQGGSGQYPPMQGAHPSQPLPTPSPSQMSAGRPVPPLPPGASQPRLPGVGSQYAPPSSSPQQPYNYNTGSVGRSPGQLGRMTGPMSRPMPSMPVPTPSGVRRMPGGSPPVARNPLSAGTSEAPSLSRLVIILVLLMVLAGGGYLGFTRLMSPGAPPAPKPVSYQPQGTPLFSDSFTSNTFGWNLQADEANFAVTIGNNMLTLECNAHKLLWELVPGSRTYNNFQVAFDAKLADGDQNNGYGIYIRGTSDAKTDLATYYRFELYGDGSYAIFKGSTDATGDSFDTKLFGYTGSSAIDKEGKINHVLIIANGAKLTFLVNGLVLRTFTDTSYNNGSIALFVSNLPEAKAGAQAQFSHFAIYPDPGTK